MKVIFVDFTKESISILIKSTFENLIIEIDIRIHKYSCADLIKWKEKGKISIQA